MKNNKRSMHINYILVVAIIGLMTVTCHIIIIDRSISRKEDILSKYIDLNEKISSMNNNIELLEMSYNENIHRMYERIVEVRKYSVNETRDAIIDSLKNNKEDPIKLEASILALIESYEEFKTDIEIQTYLNDNANIIASINRYESILDSYNELLIEYNNLYLENNDKE